MSQHIGVALVIGIGKYQHERIPLLRFARVDAMEMAETLVDPEVCGFSRDRVQLLIDAQASREAIIRLLADWLPAHAEGADLVVIYFAGHGMLIKTATEEEGYLLPCDADPDKILSRGVPMSDLTRWIRGIKAGAVVVCLDCCHAGKILPRRGESFRSMGRDLVIRPSVLEKMGGEGRFLIVSCGEGEESIEPDVYQHGLFTYHLLNGMRGLGDKDGDGRVGVGELFEYVADAVKSDAESKFGHVQKPWCDFRSTGGVFIARPTQRRPIPALDLERLWHTQGTAAALAEMERQAPEATEEQLTAILDLLRRKADPAAVPMIFRYLPHESAAVRESASSAVQAIGWERVTTAIEALAREGNAERLEFVLKGLAAFQRDPRIVTVLNRLVDRLKGDLRNRAISLLDRKRLGLELEKTANLFREIHSGYQIRNVLGQGLFTAVYLATHEWGEKDFAIRVLRPEYVDQAAIRAQFLDLSRRSVHFVHHNLVLTREVGSRPEHHLYYAVRDYVNGVTLQQALAAKREFTAVQVVALLRQVLAALTPLHEQGVVHGAIKSSNIFLGDNERLLLGDPALPVPRTALALIAGERLAYDFRYAPPELFEGKEPDLVSDLYALGCVAYELVCGQPPFVADNHFHLATLHAREPVPPPRQHGSRLGAAGDDFLLRLLAKSPAERFHDIKETLQALEALEAALTGRGNPASGVGPFIGQASLARLAPQNSIVRLPMPNEPQVLMVPEPADPGAINIVQSGLADGLKTVDWDSVQELVTRFDDACQGGEIADLELFLLPPGNPQRLLALSELIKSDLEIRWSRRRRILLEDYLKRFRELQAHPNHWPKLLHEEYRVRLKFGDRPVLADYQRRFPEQFPALEKIITETGPVIHTQAPGDAPVPPAISHANKPDAAEAVAQAAARPLPEVGNGYRCLSPLGSGTFGEVWRGEAPGGVPCAIKIIFRPIDHEEARRELQSLEKIRDLRHPCLTLTQAFWQHGDRLIILMELADGSLRDRVKECRKAGLAGIPGPELLGYFKEAAEGLDYLHEQDLLHRDIKPDNLLLFKPAVKGEVGLDRSLAPLTGAARSHLKLGDFGLVRLFEAQGMQATGAGTPAYMPPEVWNGQISKHSDQYSLAVTYAELRRGKSVFAGTNMYELMVEAVSKEPDLSGLEPGEQVVLRKALNKDAGKRYESCLDFVYALEKALWPPAPSPRSRSDDVLSSGTRRGGQSLPFEVETSAPVSLSSTPGGPIATPPEQLHWLGSCLSPLAKVFNAVVSIFRGSKPR